MCLLELRVVPAKLYCKIVCGDQYKKLYNKKIQSFG